MSVVHWNAVKNASGPSIAGRPKAAAKALLPHFLILGAAKCGTTSLYAWLDQHPQVLMSCPKEPVYFELEYAEGPDFYCSTYFAQWDGRKLLGDARTANLFFPWVPARVKESNPAAKLIILLRNPIDRALAQWWTEFRRQKEPLHFEQAVKANLERLAAGAHYETAEEFWKAAPLYQLPRHTGARHRADYHQPFRESADPRQIYRTYVDAGYYAQQIERFRKLFPDDQIKIYLMEDLRSRPLEVLEQVCRFLEIDTGSIKDIDCQSQNVSQPMKRVRAFKYWLTHRLRGERLAYRDVRLRPAVRPELRRFLADHFRPFNAELSKLLGRDLSHWN